MSSIFIILLCLPIVLLAGALVMNRAALLGTPGPVTRLTTYLTHNVAELQSDTSWPELRPEVYPVKPELLCREIPAALETLGWSWQERGNCHYQATVTTALLKFSDDVTVTVAPVGEASSHLSIRSASRVGKGDFGANRRHVLDLVAAIERQLAAGRPQPFDS